MQAALARPESKRVLYLGGPIDLQEHNGRYHEFHTEINWKGMGITPYCPLCECQGLTDEQCMEQNMLIVRRAWLALFDLRTHSVGTPIEMFLRCWVHSRPAILIGSERSMFIRQTIDRFPNTYLVPNRTIAIDKIQEILING